jgi:dCTP deaminase
MILSDRAIKRVVEEGHVDIDPYDPKFVQPNSYDLHLSKWFRAFPPGHIIDVKSSMPQTLLYERPSLVLAPREFLLASTMQRVRVPNFLCGRLEGKSSLGRLGLVVHSTAGFIDSGFNGYITLEIANLNSLPIRIYAGMPIAQISFLMTSTPVDSVYGEVEGSKYQGQEEAPVESMYWKNFPDKFLEPS